MSHSLLVWYMIDMGIQIIYGGEAMWKKTLLTLALTGVAGMAVADDLAHLKQEGRQIAKQFLGTLKPELKKAMKSGGPVHAIEVCHKKAPQITAALSEKTGWQLKRTSLKVRNPIMPRMRGKNRCCSVLSGRRPKGLTPRNWSTPKW